MRKAKVLNHNVLAGHLVEMDNGHYIFEYNDDYSGDPISWTMPTTQKRFEYDTFPPFFDGVLPEGIMLEALLKQKKIDHNDYFSQLIAVGKDLVGSVTVEADDD